MVDKQTLDELARKLAESVPPAARGLRDEMEKNFRAVLQAAFSRLDLVTREEFEVQQAVLERTREKLDTLVKRLAELETELDASAPPRRRTRKKKT